MRLCEWSADAGLSLPYGRRVHTLGLPVAAKLMYVFKGADLDAQITTLARSVAAKVRLPAPTLTLALL
jgi:hypothetical protein